MRKSHNIHSQRKSLPDKGLAQFRTANQAQVLTTFVNCGILRRKAPGVRPYRYTNAERLKPEIKGRQVQKVLHYVAKRGAPYDSSMFAKLCHSFPSAPNPSQSIPKSFPSTSQTFPTVI